MSVTPGQELRVLNGVHAGARAPLAAPLLRLGSALDNDIVLADPGIAPHHAELQWQPDAGRWQLRALDAGSGAPGTPESTLLQPGAVVRLGALQLSVAAANDPWPEAGEEKPVSVGDATQKPATGAAAPDETPATIAPPAERTAAPPAVATDTPPAAATVPRLPRVVLAAALLLAGALVLAVAWIAAAVQAPAPVPAPAGAQATMPVLPPEPLPPGLHWLQPAVDGGAPKLAGVVADDAALEALAARSARWTPRPALRVWTPSLLLAALHDSVLPGSASAVPPTLSLALRPADGAVLLEGLLPDDRLRLPLRERLGTLLPPGASIDDHRLLGPQQQADAFLARARDAGFVLEGHVEAGAGGGGVPLLRLAGRIAPERIAAWETWLVAENHRLRGALRFAIALHPPVPALPRIGLAEPRLPFAVRAVVGGASPQLLLADGRRLAPGALVDGVRLVDVLPAAIVFERGRDGQRFEVAR